MLCRKNVDIKQKGDHFNIMSMLVVTVTCAQYIIPLWLTLVTSYFKMLQAVQTLLNGHDL